MNLIEILFFCSPMRADNQAQDSQNQQPPHTTMIASPATKKSILLMRGQVLDWDRDFCRVSPCIENLFPSGHTFNLKTTEVSAEFDAQGELIISEEYFGYVIQFLAHEQSEGREGFLPTEGCVTSLKGKKYRLGYSDDPTESTGWYLVDFSA